MKTLQYICFLLMLFAVSACGFSWFPNQQEDPDVFSNVYSAKFRKKPPNAKPGKCYEKYIKSPYKYTCRRKQATSKSFNDDYSINSEFNIIVDANSRIKSSNPLWVEVICEQYIQAEFAVKLNTKLIQEGFLDPTNIPNRRIIDFRTKSALTQYQRYYCLPQGTLNMQTLIHLGL